MIPYIKIDKNSSIPLHAQLYSSLKNAILSGVLKPGDRCPTDAQIVRQFDISRPVIQQAYNQLIDDHLVDRKKGKGTYVRQKTIDFNLIQSLLPMTKLIEANGWNSSIQNLESKVLAYNPDLMGNLNLRADENVFMQHRIYMADKEPLSYFYIFLPMRFYPGIDQLDFSDKPMVDVLKKNYDYQIKRAARSIYAVIMDDEICAAFKLPKKSAGFRIESISFNQKGVPVQSSVHFIKGESTNMTVDYYRNYVKDIDASGFYPK